MELNGPSQEVRQLLSSSQKWVAKVPWAGAKLQSTPELAGLVHSGVPEEGSAEQAVSARSLAALGKALLLYANDHEDRLPETLDGVQSYLEREEWKWLKDNVEYIGKGRTMADRPGVVVAYDKALLRQGVGTLVLYLDSHVTFEIPRKLKELGVTAPASDVGQGSAQKGAVRVYEVNRSVADFPSTEDFSTPEAAYAAINRIPTNDRSAWQKVSIAALAERFAREGNTRKTRADPEWAKVLANARILQVMVWNNARAAVVAELPQAPASKKIVAPIDVRSLELVNGRWLNAGDNRFYTLEEAKAQFVASLPEAKGSSVR
jgi:hypothetical protein